MPTTCENIPPYDPANNSLPIADRVRAMHKRFWGQMSMQEREAARAYTRAVEEVKEDNATAETFEGVTPYRGVGQSLPARWEWENGRKVLMYQGRKSSMPQTIEHLRQLVTDHDKLRPAPVVEARAGQARAGRERSGAA